VMLAAMLMSRRATVLVLADMFGAPRVIWVSGGPVPLSMQQFSRRSGVQRTRTVAT
jgi:hypothetical protein